jgi:hypothetical protein
LNRNETTGFTNYAGYLQQSITANDKLETIDFNGDGKTDILHITNGKLFVYSLGQNNNIELLWEGDTPEINENTTLMFGDYNGDGKTDFMSPTANNSYDFRIYYSTGTRYIHEIKTQPFQFKNPRLHSSNPVRLDVYNLIPLDINGDGKTDIVEYNTTTYDQYRTVFGQQIPEDKPGIQKIKAYYNDGIYDTTNPTDITFSYGGETSLEGNLRHYPIPIFLTSNLPNKNLDFASISDKWITSFTFTKDHRDDMLLK